MTTHELKIWPEFWDGVVTRQKEFELRIDDRPYADGDRLKLSLYDPKREEFLGPVARCRVGKCFRNIPGLREGWVAMSIVFDGVETRRTVEEH
jgi:hypothetical protein